MSRSGRRVVKRAVTEAAAAKVRDRITRAQECGDSRTLAEFGVSGLDRVSQSRHCVARYWRVHAERVAR